MDAVALRSQFPVLERLAYLNAGTAGPVPQAALEAGVAAWEDGARNGRSGSYYEQLASARARLRAAYAALLGAAAEDVALTTSTSEGIVRVVERLELGPGDEVLTAPDEHPGLLGPLLTLRERRGIVVRTAPLARLAEAVDAKTRLVACSHVSWVSGALMPGQLAGCEVPLLLDGAQGLGAVPVDLEALGCDFYAGSGQKWLCGPIGIGALWVSPGRRERLAPLGAAYVNLERPGAGLSAAPWPDARRHDAAAIGLEAVAGAVAAHDVLAAFGWPQLQARAADLAARLAAALGERGHVVAERGTTTLVSWKSADPQAENARLAEAGVIVREIPGTGLLRAAVGAWNDTGDLDRLLAAL